MRLIDISHVVLFAPESHLQSKKEAVGQRQFILEKDNDGTIYNGTEHIRKL